MAYEFNNSNEFQEQFLACCSTMTVTRFGLNCSQLIVPQSVYFCLNIVLSIIVWEME